MAAEIRLRQGQLHKYRAMVGLSKDTGLSERMGIHRSTLIRTLSGDAELSARFIAALLGVFEPLTFDDLFEIIEPIDEQDELDVNLPVGVAS